MKFEEVKNLLGLVPLPGEGGWFRETWRSHHGLSVSLDSSRLGFSDPPHQAGTAIYYLLGPGEKSHLHRIPGDEIYHFYLGGTVSLLLLDPHHGGKLVKMGPRLDQGEQPQLLVPGGVWQGSWVMGEPGWALLGTTVVPGFEFSEWQAGDRTQLLLQYPQFAKEITHLCD